MEWMISSELNNEYEISYNGDFRRVSDSRIFKSYINKEKGYHYINLVVAGERIHKRAHRLIAKTWLENPFNLPEVNHKDGNKSNNAVGNLEWIDRQGNMLHAWRTGLKSTPVSSIPFIAPAPKRFTKKSKLVDQYLLDGSFVKRHRSLTEAAFEANVRLTGVKDVCDGNQKSAGGFSWKYVS